ncbi:TonB-dependent receptor [Pedobacter insulae]|uniref:TonB-dependent Receptor Plug Domain n=1 Tax=Pedobacter insulae TaxID=414048 RepID=A0A1I2WWV4_9SPHI|nr:TonB-dependent receptor [Pedobacter insulae]SFH05790.1 TonB-dependent Receptor Plug Domain [Pedobacter insulae]
MKQIGTIIFFLFFSFTAAFSQNLNQTVRGVITDQDSKQPIEGATVVIADSNPLKVILTRKDGSFRFDNMPIGRITIHVSNVGYEKLILPNIVVNSGKETVLNINMQEAVAQLDGIVLTFDKNKGQPLNDMTLVSGRSISPEQTNRYAGGFNDPSRILSNFAGVTSSQDGSNDIIVRGNSPKYIQWRLEGMQITNPNHFSDQSAVGGSISVLNNNLLATSDFYTGAFSAEYGDVLSGVYDVKLRQGNNEKFESIFGLGVLGTELTLEGPFKKGYKGSFLVNYRYSTVSLLSNLGLAGGIDGTLNFQDAAFKVVLPTKKAGQFSFFGIAGFSNFLFEDVSPALWQTPGRRFLPNKIGENYQKGSQLANLGMNHILTINKNSHIHTGLSFSLEGVDDDVFENFKVDTVTRNQLNFNGRLLRSTYRGEITYNNKLSSKLKLQVGSKYALLDYKFNQSMLTDSTNVRATLVNFNENISTIRNFINFRYRFNEKLTTVFGVQNMNVLLNNKHTIEPRLSLNWELSKTSVLSAGYGKHSTMESIHHYYSQIKLSDGSSIEPNKDLDLLKAHHFVLGYEKRFSKYMMIKLETYYQDLYNLPVANDEGNIFATINEGLDFQYLDLVNKGSGKNYGVELTVERFFNKNFYYLVNASVYNSTYKALDGIERNTRFNGNYLVNVLFGKDFPKLGKAQNKTISFNSRAFFGGGKKTIPLLRGADGNLAVDPASKRFYDYGKAYKNDIQDIYQLTMSLSYKINKPKATHEIFLNIENITNNRARLSEFYDPGEPGSVGYMKQGGVFPNLMYRVYF